MSENKDVLYGANVKDGLFHDEWSAKDGTPNGRKLFAKLKYFGPDFCCNFTIGATPSLGQRFQSIHYRLQADYHNTRNEQAVCDGWHGIVFAS